MAGIVDIALLGFIFNLGNTAVLGKEVEQNCTERRERGFHCYEELFGTVVNPIKGEFLSAALSDDDLGRAILRQWNASVTAFAKCRKVDPKFDSCAGATPWLPSLRAGEPGPFVRAKLECMGIVAQDRETLAAAEQLKRETQLCFADTIPEDLCMANDDVIQCYQTELLAMMRDRLALRDQGTQEMIKVFEQTRAFFEDPEKGESLSSLCTHCYSMIGPECLPAPKPELAPERREQEMFSCIAAFKGRKVAVFNRLFAACMEERGFQVDGEGAAIIPDPRKWQSVCMGMDAE